MLKQSHKHQIFEHFHHLGNTVDWFSNPKEPPWDLFKTLWKNRISTTNLNWLAGFLPSSSINSSTAPHILGAFSGFSDGREGTWEMVIDGGIAAKTPGFAGGQVSNPVV